MIDENDYKLGIAWQDIQHRRIINLISDISNNPHIDYKFIFDELDFYTKDHFETEELYMRESNYEKAESHIEEHNNFIVKLAEIMQKCFADNELHSSLSSFLNEWFTNHILVVDKELAVFLLNYRRDYS